MPDRLRLLPNVSSTNGIIEYDIAVDGSRGYPRRARSVPRRMLEYENFYIRPHASGLPDAMQYNPVRGGIASWQLYHGDGFTSAAVIPRDEWLHVKLEILGRQARVFLGESVEPALVIHQLKHDLSEGFRRNSLRSAAARPASRISAYTVTDDLTVRTAAAAHRIRGAWSPTWEMSQPFDALAIERDELPGRRALLRRDRVA